MLKHTIKLKNVKKKKNKKTKKTILNLKMLKHY